MVSANHYLQRLQPFAESFTGFPVRIVTSDRNITERGEDTEDYGVKLYVPRDVKPRTVSDEERLAFSVYKGIIALQSSAFLYSGVPSAEEIQRFAEDWKIPRRESVSTLDELLHGKDSSGTLSGCFNTIELSRRLQCIEQDYPRLSREIKEGFRSVLGSETRRYDDIKWTNEVDLAFMMAYWKLFGVDEETLKSLSSRFPRNKLVGKLREDFYAAATELTSFDSPLDSSYVESVQRTGNLVDYCRELSRELGLPSPLHFVEEQARNFEFTEEDRKRKRENGLDKIKIREEEIKRIISGEEKPSLGLSSQESRERRLKQLQERRKDLQEQGSYYPKEEVSLQNTYAIQTRAPELLREALSNTFQDVPQQQIFSPEVPIGLERKLSGKYIFLPEVREGVLVPRAVRVSQYDLLTEFPLSEEQHMRQTKLERQIGELEDEISDYRRKMQSPSWDIYDTTEIRKKRTRAERALKKLREELEVSRDVHQEIARKPIEVDHNLAMRVHREMESVKPEARSIVRNCFEGELDEKKYFDYWLEEQQGGNPIPRFYYQWQKRKRDVASVLLIDASNSTNRLADEERTVLDFLKESAYYLAIGAEALEDKLAVFAYNGKGPSNVRVFTLKDFEEEGIDGLRERLELLSGELNNRDGSAVRYTTDVLVHHPAKTRFLFHLSDMQPSDLEFESPVQGIKTFRYQGETAIEDIVQAYRSARTQGIIPVGIAIQPERRREETTKPTPRGKLNPRLLAKMRERVVQPTSDTDPRIRGAFQRNFMKIEDIKELPSILRRAYLDLSFRE